MRCCSGPSTYRHREPSRSCKPKDGGPFFNLLGGREVDAWEGNAATGDPSARTIISQQASSGAPEYDLDERSQHETKRKGPRELLRACRKHALRKRLLRKDDRF